MNNTDFLGKEFLIWLWHKSEIMEGRYTFENELIHIWIDDFIVLESQFGDARESRLSKGEPSISPEAAMALYEGKKVKECKIKVEFGPEKNALFTLKGTTLQLASIKLPLILLENDEEIFIERVHWLEKLDRLISVLFEDFVRERLEKDAWKERKERIVQWIRQKRESC
ncbi:hypothetical protein LGV61_04785 [Desulfurispirillum indicum]|uniref:Uncharacterized protein n=1 Tax=Desulfurispirillum indicum (strain ATCC BAA-1389 / DSM 22839 / S5) TaxID=653733 RepID=E6W2B2_DESIS|nr:hypothetical protein [Desulfurispirillum indicum]ADU65570.1 hypothetical protein Selin_0830 [Desulfurispirillum indicum S5]UCZ57598.1 hypothetical protein LGV61_04785 [Desulfurispirillum indicum]